MAGVVDELLDRLIFEEQIRPENREPLHRALLLKCRCLPGPRPRASPSRAPEDHSLAGPTFPAPWLPPLTPPKGLLGSVLRDQGLWVWGVGP